MPLNSRALYSHAELERIFHPRTIAIVGATPNTKAFAGRTMDNLKHFNGKVLLVNPKYDKVGDQPCYPALSALPEVPDCVLIATGRDTVEPIVRECGALGVGGVVVFASGFGETGKPEAQADQARLVELARAHGVRLLGPNCIGYANYVQNANVSFAYLPPRTEPLPRHAIGVVSQSGALAFALEQGARNGVAFSHVLTCGNAGDVDVADQVAYLAADPECAAIACIFEGLADASRIIDAAGISAAAGKPLVVYKIARGTAGAAAALSHTGSIAGSDRAYSTAFRHAGIVQVDSMEALLETTLFFAKAPRPSAPGVAIVSSSGGAGIIAADEAELRGVALPQPGERTRGIIEKLIPDFGSASNPCDLTAQVANNFDNFQACGDAFFADPAYGAVLAPLVVTGDNQVDRLRVYNELAARHGKVGCCLWMTEWTADIEKAHALPRMAVFRSPARCLATLVAWHERDRWLQQRAQPRPARLSAEAVAPDAAHLIRNAGSDMLTERESKKVLAQYGVPVVQELLVQDERAAAKAALQCVYPVVLKVESPDIPHKSEAGVIRLNVGNEAELLAAYREIMANARRVTGDDRINGVLVQSQVPAGVEILVGARIDPHLGAMLVVGTGGVLVELMKDTVTTQAPCSPEQARGLLQQLRGYALLKGFRGAQGANVDRLAEVIARLSEFAADQRELVSEFDLNPLICAGDRIVAVDALISRRPLTAA